MAYSNGKRTLLEVCEYCYQDRITNGESADPMAECICGPDRSCHSNSCLWYTPTARQKKFDKERS